MDTLIVTGGNSTRRQQIKQIVSNVLNNNFTRGERKNIGPVTINLNPGNLSRNYVADTGRKKGVTDIRLGRGIRAPDLKQALTHELVHVNRRAQGEPYRNEKKIDLEVMGRLSPSGIRTARTGYYFDPKLKFKPGTSMDKKIGLVRDQIRQDRRLLTGSVGKSMEGNRLENRVDRLFKKSQIAKRPKRFG